MTGRVPSRPPFCHSHSSLCNCITAQPFPKTSPIPQTWHSHSWLCSSIASLPSPSSAPGRQSASPDPQFGVPAVQWRNARNQLIFSPAAKDRNSGSLLASSRLLTAAD